MDSAAEAFRRNEERLQKLSLQPSEFVRRQMRVTPYPHEDAGWIVENSGPEVAMFSSDYPHVEGGRNPLEALRREPRRTASEATTAGVLLRQLRRPDGPDARPAGRPARARLSYAFGDGDVAARRLALVAATFEPPSRRFVLEHVTNAPRLAVDLGCGPGFTTAMLARATGAVRTVGVDLSVDFLHRAATVEGAVGAVAADVTAPLPFRRPDLLYARLLLAHLPDVAGTVDGWASQLAPGGRLLLDEIDAITTDVDALARYEEVVVELVGSRGASMYAGPAMAAVRVGPGWRQVADHRFAFPVDPRVRGRDVRAQPHRVAPRPGRPGRPHGRGAGSSGRRPRGGARRPGGRHHHLDAAPGGGRQRPGRVK